MIVGYNLGCPRLGRRVSNKMKCNQFKIKHLIFRTDQFKIDFFLSTAHKEKYLAII